MKKKKNKGQVLVLLLLLIPTLFIFLAFMVNAGVAVRNRIKLQNSCDAAALSGAEVYAKCLNGLKILNTAYCVAWASDTGVFLDTGIDPNVRKLFGIPQDIIMNLGPRLIQLEALYIAQENGCQHLVNVPPSPIVAINGEVLNPSLAVDRLTLVDSIFGQDTGKRTFSYQPKDGSPRVTVSEDECSQDRRGRWHYRGVGEGGMSYIYVRENPPKKENGDALIVETVTDHRVAVFCTQPQQSWPMSFGLFGLGKMYDQMYAVSEAGIGGGTLAPVDLDPTNPYKFYSAFFQPFMLEDLVVPELSSIINVLNKAGVANIAH